MGQDGAQVRHSHRFCATGIRRKMEVSLGIYKYQDAGRRDKDCVSALFVFRIEDPIQFYHYVCRKVGILWLIGLLILRSSINLIDSCSFF